MFKSTIMLGDDIHYLCYVTKMERLLTAEAVGGARHAAPPL